MRSIDDIYIRNENTHKFLTNYFSLRTPGVERVRNRDF